MAGALVFVEGTASAAIEAGTEALRGTRLGVLRTSRLVASLCSPIAGLLVLITGLVIGEGSTTFNAIADPLRLTPSHVCIRFASRPAAKRSLSKGEALGGASARHGHLVLVEVASGLTVASSGLRCSASLARRPAFATRTSNGWQAVEGSGARKTARGVASATSRGPSAPKAVVAEGLRPVIAARGEAIVRVGVTAVISRGHLARRNRVVSHTVIRPIAAIRGIGRGANSTGILEGLLTLQKQRSSCEHRQTRTNRAECRGFFESYYEIIALLLKRSGTALTKTSPR